MITTHTFGKETWIDIDSGTPEEIHSIIETYNIDPYVAHELTSVTRKPRIEFHDGYIYCILHFPAWKHTHTKESNQEIDFIIGKNVLITARYDTIDTIHKFSKTLEVKDILRKHSKASEYSLFISLLRDLYAGLGDELSAIDDATDDITNRIFRGKEREMVISISQMTRTLLDFKRMTDLHRDVLETLHTRGAKMCGDEFGQEVQQILLDYLKINNALQSNLDMLRELRETNNSLLTTKQNETVKQLTVMGFVILPLNLIAWIFAMRVEGLPFLDNPNGFLIVAGLMITSTIVTLTYAHHKKWL